MIKLSSFIYLLVSQILCLDQWQCTCEQLMTEFDCMTQQKNRFRLGEIDQSSICFWYQEKCQNLMNYLSDVSCTSLNNQECSFVSESLFTINPVCAWYYKADGGQCTKFTRCQDYKYQSELIAEVECSNLGCNRIKNQCSFDYRGRQEQYCSEIGDQKTCDITFLKDKLTICQWNTSTKKCGGFNFEQCSDLTTEQNCDFANTFCKWKDQLCIERVCGDKELEYKSGSQICISFYSLTNKKYMQCVENNNGDCIESDPETLLPYQCNYFSRLTYLWNTTTSSCTPCLYVGQSDIIKVAIIILFVIFL
ncbi:unnamed protein product [Paramecium pentaurelia]|uniref:Transmembrane protein n=1 Tax=Paramecium pentaurelia TaxID=43138 RepID=A0A8S1S009_9CILI|nr:unnamed protein product [Paramecium pentaurelia]